MIESIEETLNGGYAGLFGEVVTDDIYKLRSLDWQPDCIIDIGSNVGIFTRFAKELFPKSIIVSVEPDEENFKHLIKFTNHHNVYFINKAIGHGSVWRHKGAINGSGESYVTDGLGYPESEMNTDARMIKTEIESVTLYSLIDEFVKPGMRSIVKIDCEGGENAIFSHTESMYALRKIDYIVMEVHFYSLTGVQSDEVRSKTMSAFSFLEQTHHCTLDHIYFYATKK